MFDFTGKVAIVTGGTKGIGKAISENFLKNGAKVIITYSSNDKAAEDFKVENENHIDYIEFKKFDVSKYDEVESFYNEIIEKYGKIDILVNNSGIRKDSVLAMMPKEDWHNVINVNLTGVYNMTKFAIMNMSRKRYGKIINVTSPSGKMGFEGQSNYAASKAGMVALTKSVSKEVAKRKINVNCISPGFIDTDFIKDLPEELTKEYKKTVPMKRFGQPNEVANAVAFLASDEAAYITGTTLEITGGL